MRKLKLDVVSFLETINFTHVNGSEVRKSDVRLIKKD